MKAGIKRFWVPIVVALLLVYSCLGIVAADDPIDSLLSINMTGVNSSFLTIGAAGMNASKLTIDTPIVVIELTGLHVYPISCSFGLLRPGDIRATDVAFAILNASNVTINVTIGVAGDWGGSQNWTHSDECMPGVDTAGLIAIVENGSGYSSVIVTKTEPYNYLAIDLAPGETRRFALEIYAPTSFSDYSPKSNSIFVTVEGL